MKVCDSRVVRVALVWGIGLGLFGCAKKTEEYRMGQPINMGPFSFEVERTEESRRLDLIGGPTPQIKVYYRMLYNKTPPFGTTFDEVLVDVRLVDHANNRIDWGGRVVVSGNRHHPSEWYDLFTVGRSFMGVRDKARLGQRASDFRLIIDNPEVRAGQPERVSIPLR